MKHKPIPMISMLSKKRHSVRDIMLDLLAITILAAAALAVVWSVLHTVAELI